MVVITLWYLHYCWTLMWLDISIRFVAVFINFTSTVQWDYSVSHSTELAAALCPLFLRVCAVKGLTEFCLGSDTCSLLFSIVITRWDFCNGLPLCRHQFSLTKTYRFIYVFIILFYQTTTVSVYWRILELVFLAPPLSPGSNNKSFLLTQSYMLKSVNCILTESLCGKDVTGTWPFTYQSSK